MAIQPYQLKLQQVEGSQQRLLRAIYAYLPATGMQDLFAAGVRDAVARHVGESIDFHLEALHQESFGTCLERLADPSLIVVIGLAPLAQQAFLEIDQSLALMVIERMLGGPLGHMTEARELSETEQGVFQYLILQILAHLHRACGDDNRVGFRFDRFAFHPHQIQEIASPDDGVAELIFRVQLGHTSGFVRLMLPNPFVQEAFLNVAGIGENRASEQAWRQRELKRFASVEFPLVAEAGRMSVTPQDVAQLEEGDIILFDESRMKLEQGHPAGRVRLTVGDGLHGAIQGDLMHEGDRLRVRIAGVE